ncbi:MAG: TonB-dependent receptor plug domain-containing protein [Gemmatimonadota bacterium]|nr:TonB-dependent receptor plug domain-containing protein [Gemmatimonadota bacterium]
MRSWNMLVAIGMLGVGVSTAEAQTRTVSGRVIDARTKRPVPVGSVSIKGTSVRDHLRPDGVFVLHVPLRDVTMIIQSQGYRRHTVTVSASQETAFVSLIPDIVEVEGIVISGSPDDRANRATSTTTVRAGDIDKVPAASIKQALQGKVAGADIQYNSGVPGGDLQLTLRGVTTLMGATSPLYVVDGVIVSNASIASGAATVTGGQESLPGRISDLNPNDIERIEILKGAAASAMYGSKGANGVVIITTRRR